MAAYISRKISWLRFLASLLPGAGTAALLCAFFSGPRLGPLYDFLLRRRAVPPPARELLLIDSSVPGRELEDDILEPGAASSLLYTMTEFDAGALIIQVPILGLSAGGTVGEAEIVGRFDEEFSLLSRNIRNLFDAIRTGSVAPGDAAGYVGELVELSEQGKNRLVSALVRRDEEGIDNLEKAAAFFGNLRRPGDLRVRLIRMGEGGRPGALAERDEYSRARPDSDGILRRIAPVLPGPFFAEPREAFPGRETAAEHIIYGALKTRYESAEIEYPGSVQEDALFQKSPVLILRTDKAERETIIPLDRNGAILFEIPRPRDDFRRIGISEFLAYDEADRYLRRLIEEGETLGIYQGLEGENHPGILWDFALSLREELVLTSANEEGKALWRESRERYFAGLEEFLYGPAEMNMVSGYEEIIASESLDEAGTARMTEMRDSLIRAFVNLRAKYNEVRELRNKLEAALAGSFCILGRSPARPVQGAQDSGSSLFRALARAESFFFSPSNPGDMEASALLANSILTRRVITPGEDMYLLAASLIAAFLACFFVKSLGPASTLGLGAFFVFFAGAGFSLSFIFSAIWLDPLIPAASAAAGVLASYVWALAAEIRYSRHFRQAFGPRVSRACLKSVIKAGKPLPSQIITARAAVAAVKNNVPAVKEDSPGNAAREVLAFQKKVSEIFTEAGGTVIGTESDMVWVCFGSPLERVFLRNKKEPSPYEDSINAKAAPAARAIEFITEITAHPECASWRFGLDTGNCSFMWTALSGYSALGVPVQKAKVLARLAGRYSARVVISSPVNEALPDLVAKKLGTFRNPAGMPGEAFYGVNVRS